jgi:Protein of unknown function (DUF3105)
MPPKKKPRTPPPPRRVQAPQTRTGTRGPSDLALRQRAIRYGFAALGVVGLVVVIAVFALGGGSSSSAQAAITSIQAANCQFKTYPALPRTPHYMTLNPSPPPRWNSFPPSSGRHYTQPLVFGQYDQPVVEIQALHNLEHGAMILQYGNKVPKAQVAAITQWYRKDPNAVLVAPLPALGDKVAMTAWTRWSECTGFNQKAANAFRTAFRYQAPEKFPKSFLGPGQ